MTNPKKLSLDHVLVATDLEDTSLEALREADRWVRATGGTLHVVTVVTLGDSVAEARPTEADEVRKADAEAHVRLAIGRSPGEYTLHVERGFPPEAIVTRAKDVGAGLVVVGTHDRGVLRRFLLGSVAQRVVREAPCPVLIARPSPKGGPVLAACQLDELTRDVVAWAAKLVDDERLVLLHTEKLGVSDVALVAAALFSGAVPPTPSRETIDSIREMARGALSAELESSGAAGDVEVAEGPAAATILARAKALGASLVVLGSHGRRGLTRAALGSVAEVVARDASTSVLVVR
jgi:nucleotide-binding universal stress UspA family protein